jgi:thioredoxin reductase (NADPH)
VRTARGPEKDEEGMADQNGSHEAYEIIIVGAGPAGQTAALYAGRSRIPTLVLERGIPGGQLWNTAEVEDYPGIEHIMGPELADRMQKHAEKFGARFETGEATSISLDGEDRVVTTADGREFRAPAVIVTAGGEARKLGVPGEDEYAGKGVSYCAVCDGAFFQDAVIAVVGGGDSAVEEGTFLTRYGSKVYVIHRRDGYRAQPILVEQMRATGKVEEVLNTVVQEIHATDGRVSHMTVRDVRSGETSTLSVGAVFPFVGFTPHSDIFDPQLAEQIDLDESGHIVTDDQMRTSVPGIYAAGDVRSQFVRQITNAVGDATTAALAAHAYVEHLKHARSKRTEEARGLEVA